MSKLALFFLMTLLFLPVQAKALSSNWQRDGAVDARLISGIEGVGQKKIIPLGIEVRMEPGWHTYWRSPGVAGLPPQLDWSKSENDTGNLRKATLFFPAPKRYSDHDLETIGYQSRVIFPIDAELRHTGQPLIIDTTFNLLACSTLCVPKTFVLKLQVPKETATEGPEADILSPARALVPGRDEDRSGLFIKNIVNNGASLSLEISSREPIIAPDVFIESEPEIPFTVPDIKLSADRLEARLTVKPADLQQDLSAHVGTALILTIVDDGHALEAPVTVPPVPGSGAGERPLLSLRLALLLAIAGGFILNLMPCVLPVLSLKIMGLIGHGGGEAVLVRRSFLTSAAGIMFSFLVLALTTVMLKKLGMTLGWGVQFQQPLFLIVLILLLTFFAANMWGLFEIRLPSFLADKLADHHPRMAGDFATGALATLLATPCTAPLLGTAVGFALASGTSKEIVAIFLALGFGMTLPYLAIAMIPELATFLPKPGAWMKRLRIALGIALALTAIWLLWILAAQIMLRYALTVAACMLGIVALLGIPAAGRAKKIVTAGLLAFSIIAVSLALGGAPPPGDAVASADKLWQRFDEPSIAIQVASGRTVFVDITADWCLTCKANKKFVLSDEDIGQRLFHGNIVAMQGDWTNPDPDITNFLHKFRRYGIPFNVVYGPGAPQGITLPELLTHDSVMEALNKAERP
jgi:suppressor for copper-sensitivity B